jgi:AP2 domain
MIKVPLTGKHAKGRFAIVDSDMRHVLKYTWWASLKASGLYAVTGANLYLHHLVLPEVGAHVDHRNGDTLDCRRKNLRPTTVQNNIRNQRKQCTSRGTTSKFKGVWHVKRQRPLSKPYRVRIGISCGVYKQIGYFATEEEAARAYDTAARKYFGEFACTNFPRRGERAALG